DGRAVRRARRADPASARRQGSADPATAQANNAAHHPQYHRGGATFGPNPGDDLSPGPGEAHRGHQAAAAAQFGNRIERGMRPLRRANRERFARGGEPRLDRRGGAHAAGGRGPMTAALARNRYVPAAIGTGSLVVLLALIELLIRIGLINRFIVPMPSEIIAAFPRVITEENVLQRFLLTAGEAFSASILVTVFGVAGGVLLYRYYLLRLATETWVAAVAAAPLVLMYPLYLVIF